MKLIKGDAMRPTKIPNISIVIPTFNEERTIKNCLESLYSIDYPKENFEIIIADGGSKDNTLDIVRNYQEKLNIKLVNGGTRGEGCNTGIENALYPYIVFTDADCTFGKEWLKTLVSTLLEVESKNVVSVGGPNITPYEDTLFARCVGYVTSSFWGSGGSRFGWKKKEACFVDHNSGCNVIYKKNILEEIGKFDTSLKTAEDVDLDYRILKKGYKLYYTPDAVVMHWRRATWRKFFRQYYYNAVGKMQLFRKYGISILSAYKYMPYHLLPLVGAVGFLFLTITLSIYYGLGFALLFFMVVLLIYLLITLLFSIKSYPKFKSMKAVTIILLLYVMGHISWIWGLMRGLLPYRPRAAK